MAHPAPPTNTNFQITCCMSKIVNMLGRNDLITNKLTICWKGKQSLQAYYAKGRNQCRNTANDRFGKGFQALKDHVLNCLMTGRCLCKSLAVEPKFHSLSLQNSFDFQKMLHLKDINHHLEYTDVNFNPENGAFSKIKK